LLHAERSRYSRVSLGQGDELDLVAGDLREAAVPPLLLGLLEALLRARDEVPEDVPLAVERRTADEL